METRLQERYFRVRRELAGLNYEGNFGIDALDIVEQLFHDLISTTESYTHMQEKEQQLSQNLALAQAQVFPLRKENAKLVRENQQLQFVKTNSCRQRWSLSRRRQAIETTL
jgi:centrosomal protein CEP135